MSEKSSSAKETSPAEEDTAEENQNNDKTMAANFDEMVEGLGRDVEDRYLRVLTADDEEEIPRSHRYLLYTITAFVALFIFWANFATLDEITRGMGRVIPSSEIKALQSLDGGIVEEFLVREGENIVAGQPLIRLRDIEATSNYEANYKRFLSLKAKAIRLRAEAEGQDTPEFDEEIIREVPGSVREELETFSAQALQLDSQLLVLRRQRDQRQQEIEELQSRITDLKKVIQLSQEEIDLIAPLVERGSAPQVELLQLERSLQERQSELNSVQKSLPRAQSAVEEAEARLEQVRSAMKARSQNELAATTIELNSIRETLAALKDRQTRTEIRSPVSGTVKDLKVNTIGGVVDPGEDIIEIVPDDEQLIVEARIRPQDIAFLRPGQPAVIKITAYDFSIYGGLKGELTDISADTMVDEEGNTFYRVRLQTDKITLTRKGEVLPVIPGMVASVDILTGKKTVMQYILKPIIKTINESLTER